MLKRFIEEKMKTAKYERLDDGTYFGDIPSIRGLWGNAKNLKKCKEELAETLEESVLLDIRDNIDTTGFISKNDIYKNKIKVPARIKQGHAQKSFA